MSGVMNPWRLYQNALVICEGVGVNVGNEWPYMPLRTNQQTRATCGVLYQLRPTDDRKLRNGVSIPLGISTIVCLKIKTDRTWFGSGTTLSIQTSLFFPLSFNNVWYIHTRLATRKCHFMLSTCEPQKCYFMVHQVFTLTRAPREHTICVCMGASFLTLILPHSTMLTKWIV